jgi:acetyl esterase
VLHDPPLDLGVAPADKHSPLAKTVVTPEMAETFDDAYAPTRELRLHRLVSPANEADTADLTGIAPALIITPVNDTLHDEAVPYANRLAKVGALIERIDVPDADHGYDMNDRAKAATSYARIAVAVRAATRR